MAEIKRDNSNEPGWHLAYCRPAMDMKAAEEIAGMGFTVYVPRFAKEQRQHRTKAWTTRFYSILGGYIFVLASRHWPRINGCENVQRIICTAGGTPITIPDRIVQALRKSQEAGEFDRLRLHGRIDPGTEVKVLDGALAGLKGEVAASDDGKVVMMLEMFGREVKAKAPVEILGKIG